MPSPDRRHAARAPIVSPKPGGVVPACSFGLARAVPTGRWTPSTEEIRSRRRQVELHSEEQIAEMSLHDEYVWNDGENLHYRRIGGLIAVRLRAEERLVRLIALPGVEISAALVPQLEDLLVDHEIRYLTTTTVEAMEPILETGAFKVVAPLADADYGYLMRDLATMAGGVRRKPRREATAFEDAYRGRIDVREGLLTERWAQRFLFDVYEQWVRAKFGSPLHLPPELRREWNGVLGMPEDHRAARLRLFALTVDQEPVCASVIEPMTRSLWMGTVQKSDRGRFLSSTAFLRRHICRIGLEELGADGRLSLMQDVGDLGLAHSKRAYGPAFREAKFALLPNVPTLDIQKD